MGFRDSRGYVSKNSIAQDTQKSHDQAIKDDLYNSEFNSEIQNKLPFHVTSTILSMTPSSSTEMNDFWMDKAAHMQPHDPTHEYVNLVLQKEYTQNKQVLFKQELLKLEFDNHRIVSRQEHEIMD